MGIKFIHCSDLHLDTPFKRLSAYDGELAKRMAESAYDALDTIVDTAIREKVDFIIFSGDIFDIDHSTPTSRYRFAKAVERSGVRCYIAYGNHDYMRKWESSIPFPPNAVVFPDHVVNIPYPNEDEKIADVIGISHSRKNEDRDLTIDINGSSAFSIAVVHCDVDAASEGKRYAPASMQSMLQSKIDYWALGHIHKRNVLHKFPHIVYPGNTQGRSPRETGEKGAYIVTVENNTVTKMEFFVTGSILWEDIEADITGMDLNSLLDGIAADARPGSVIRLTVKGRGDLDSMIRLEEDHFRELVESRTGCVVSSIRMMSAPDVDLDARIMAGDLISSIITTADGMAILDHDTLVDMICSTKASAAIRNAVSEIPEDELKEMVNDSLMSLMDRFRQDGGLL